MRRMRANEKSYYYAQLGKWKERPATLYVLYWKLYKIEQELGLSMSESMDKFFACCSLSMTYFWHMRIGIGRRCYRGTHLLTF
jgi:hypothetical protein